jgi:DNA gyrase subunit B
MAKVSYDESSISRQLGLEGVREFPTMYLGERGDSMAFQGAKEIIDNANDEFLAGRNKSVFMYADNKRNQYMVADEAEGVPVGLRAIDPSNPKSKKVSTLTMIFTELHTGGKVNNKAYKFSKGVHGVGAACTNAVSSSFEVWTRREGIWYYQKFEKGVPSFDLKSRSVPDARVVKILGKKPTRGTIILWSFDQSIISIDKGKTKAVVNMQFMANWVKTYADLNPGIVMTVATPKHRKTFCNKEGIKSLLKKRVEDAGLTPLGRPLVYESEDMTLSIQWTNRPDDTGLETYVCSGRTIFDGEHEVGFRKQ